jgi:hypothetical protein
MSALREDGTPTRIAKEELMAFFVSPGKADDK